MHDVRGFYRGDGVASSGNGQARFVRSVASGRHRSDIGFHEADNLYAVGPALLPTLGSPNPMLTCVALSRRTGDHLVLPPVIAAPALEISTATTIRHSQPAELDLVEQGDDFVPGDRHVP